MPIDSARILGSGWRQGSIFPLEVSRLLVREHRDAISVQVVALMETADYEDAEKRAAVDAAMARTQEVLDRCPDVAIEICIARSMGQMTLDEFRAIWDYDDLSLDANAQAPQHMP